MSSQIGFRMVKISIDQFAILAENLPNESDGLSMGLDLTLKSSIDKRVVGFTFKVIFQDGKVGENLLLLENTCLFEIEEETWESLKDDEGNYILPRGFACHLAMHTIGTARGILHCKTESSVFNALILPGINVEEMITDESIKVE